MLGPRVCSTALACAIAGLLTGCAGGGSSAGTSSSAPVPSWARTADTTCDLVAAPNGSDRAAGTTGDPLRSARRLMARLRPGQIGCLREGRYYDDVSARHGRTTLKAYGTERAVVVGRFWIPRSADHVTVQGLVLDGRNARRLPSPTINGDHAAFVGNEVTTGHDGICFDLGGAIGYGIPQHTTLSRNRIHACGDLPATNRQHGIYVEHARFTRIADNVIYDNADRGIQLYPDAQHTTIVGNVVDGNGEGIIFSGDGRTASSHATVERNLITNARVRANVESWWGGSRRGVGNVVRGNCVWGGRQSVDRSQGGFRAGDNVAADPRYRDRARADYRIDAGGPCAALLKGSSAPAGPRGEAPVRTTP